MMMRDFGMGNEWDVQSRECIFMLTNYSASILKSREWLGNVSIKLSSPTCVCFFGQRASATVGASMPSRASFEEETAQAVIVIGRSRVCKVWSGISVFWGYKNCNLLAVTLYNVLQCTQLNTVDNLYLEISLVTLPLRNRKFYQKQSFKTAFF